MPAAREAVRHRKIGPYRVTGELGRGGMALVYRGIHESLNREAAIKELLPEGMKNAENRSRFQREALALASFRHQNIVTVYDLVEKSDSFFLVMELVDGPTLQDLIRQGPFPAEVAAAVASRLASALEHAHFKRIIHRDLKPANAMITKSGEVKLMDFGIAKDEGLDALTRAGVTIGTPSYMSPEQVMGASLDPRTDIFSLGILLYEMLSGKKPFLGTNPSEVFARIREGRYPPLLPQTPRVLQLIVKRALQPNLDNRYFDAAEMARALDAYLARVLTLSPQALMVAFLRQRGKLTESEALALVTQRELSFVEVSHPDKERSLSDQTLERRAFPGRGRWKWMLAVGALGTAAYLSQHLWLKMLPWP